MSEYVIFTDAGCDVPVETLDEWGVEYCDMTLLFDGENEPHSNRELDIKAFYDRMRQGGVARTSAINVEAYKEYFAKTLAKGLDVLYIGLSSGLSNSCAHAQSAAEELTEEYPGRRVIVEDSLGASGGFALTVFLTVQKKRSGATLEEAAKFVEDTRLHLCHWFTVEDLVYLKRGGRVSAAAAFAAGVLGIKPVLHMDDPGHLINKMKVRGRKMSIKAIADKYGELALDPKNGTVFISNGDCMEDALALADMLKQRYGVTVDRITSIGPTIGAHSGPGTLALFFLGTHR